MSVDLSKLEEPKHTAHCRCTLHNINFSAETIVGDSYKVRCPLCHFDEVGKLCRQLDEVRGHRDMLIRAIEIKQTIIPLDVPPSSQ
jgi:hypothetical protein